MKHDAISPYNRTQEPKHITAMMEWCLELAPHWLDLWNKCPELGESALRIIAIRSQLRLLNLGCVPQSDAIHDKINKFLSDYNQANPDLLIKTALKTMNPLVWKEEVERDFEPSDSIITEAATQQTTLIPEEEDEFLDSLEQTDAVRTLLEYHCILKEAAAFHPQIEPILQKQRNQELFQVTSWFKDSWMNFIDGLEWSLSFLQAYRSPPELLETENEPYLLLLLELQSWIRPLFDTQTSSMMDMEEPALMMLTELIRLEMQAPKEPVPTEEDWQQFEKELENLPCLSMAAYVIHTKSKTSESNGEPISLFVLHKLFRSLSCTFLEQPLLSIIVDFQIVEQVPTFQIHILENDEISTTIDGWIVHFGYSLEGKIQNGFASIPYSAQFMTTNSKIGLINPNRKDFFHDLWVEVE